MNALTFVLALPIQDRKDCLSAMSDSVLDSMAAALSLADKSSGIVSPDNAHLFIQKLRVLNEFLRGRVGNFGAVPEVFADTATNPNSTDHRSSTDDDAPVHRSISLPINALIDTMELIEEIRRFRSSEGR